MIFIMLWLIYYNGVLFVNFKDTCYRPTTITFLAVNTSNGTALKYKISSSDTTGTILFEDAYLPSPSACGDDSQRCQNLTVITHEDVIVVAIPLRKNFGIATFENNGSFREKRLFNFTQECELVSIFPHALQRNMLPLQGVCLHGNQNGFLLNQIYISINATHLTESLGTQRERGTRQLPMCQVVNPSAFIYSNSPAISSSLGATIFVDVRTVFVQITNQRCDPQNDPMECSVLQRFVSITPNVHAIYCNMQTYLFRLDRNSLMEFAKSVEGLPFFCSSTMYYAFKEGNLTLHHVGNRSASGVAVPFYFQNITRGDCAVLNHSQIVLVQLSDGTVVSMNFSHPHNTLGFSSSPPRRFDRFVLLSNATHALVHDLLSGGLVDTLEESSPFMGYVLGISSEAVPCFVTPTTSSRPPKETTTPAVIGVSAAVRLGLGLGLGLITVLIIVIVVVIIGIKM